MQILSKANPEAIKQAKMEKQAQSRPVVKPPTTLITTTKPSIDMLDMLENLGSLNSRFSELTDKVQGIGEELTHKADLDEVGKNSKITGCYLRSGLIFCHVTPKLITQFHNPRELCPLPSRADKSKLVEERLCF